MTYDLNAEIETLLTTLKIPYGFMFYEGNADTYITYGQQDKDDALAGDDKIVNFVIYYDFDIYSKGDYTGVISSLIETFENAGWTYQPSRESPDLYERDTKLFHRTICLAKERG